MTPNPSDKERSEFDLNTEEGKREFAKLAVSISRPFRHTPDLPDKERIEENIKSGHLAEFRGYKMDDTFLINVKHACDHCSTLLDKQREEIGKLKKKEVIWDEGPGWIEHREVALLSDVLSILNQTKQ